MQTITKLHDTEIETGEKVAEGPIVVSRGADGINVTALTLDGPVEVARGKGIAAAWAAVDELDMG